MTHALTVESGETYRVDSGTTETHASATVDGTLTFDGTLTLTGDEPRAIKPVTGIDLPLAVTFRDMNMGISVFLVGILATTLSASWMLKNYAAGVMWGIAFVALIIGGIMGMGLEIFWMAVVATVILLIVGMVVRWSAG